MSDTNVNQKVTLIQKLNSSKPLQLASIDEVEHRFKKIYAIMNGGNNRVSEIKYEAEKFHFSKLIQDKPELVQCTMLSLYGCFMDMAVNGLSFDPAMKQAYIVSFNTNVGSKQSPKWEKRASLMISGYGELAMRVQQKQIKYADNPVLVYEGDDFKFGTKNGSIFLEHTAKFPRESDTIIASYIRLERIDGTYDYKVLGMNEIQKFRNKSKDPNSLAWTDGLPGMVQAKTIKHAFRSYPKIKMGQFTQLQSDTVDTDAEIDTPVDYGFDEVVETQALPESNISAPSVKADFATAQTIADDSFSQTTQTQNAGMQFDDDNF